MPTLCLLGRQPAIGRAELESLYGAHALTPLGDHAALVEAEVDFARLGGSVKAATYLTTVTGTNAQKAFDYCRRALPNYVRNFPEGKIKLGVSLYGLDMPLHKINANTLSLKKSLKITGRSVRVIPNTEPALSSAQTYHNALTSPVGLELVFIRHGHSIVIGHVTHVQDIDSYTLRDRGRPKRDAFVGMLPPKLAQILINLAVGTPNTEQHVQHERSKRALGRGADITNLLRNEAEGQAPPIIVDPFCGTGVVLQEALLMGYSVYGTDLSPKMIDYSRTNLKWLVDDRHLTIDGRKKRITLQTGDAIDFHWDFPFPFPLSPSLAVACEAYLGQPLGGQQPTPDKLAEIIHDCQTVIRGFLRNIASQVPAGTRFCIAAPAWYLGDRLHHLPVLDDLEDMGYNRIDFEYATRTELIYRRDDQIVGRELLVLIKQ